MSLFPESWKLKEANLLCDKIVDCINKTAPVVDYETQYKMIRTTNVKNGRINLDNARNVDEAIFLKWNRRLTPKRNDIILTREAPLGDVGLVRTDDSIFLGQRTMLYRANEKILNQIFLYYTFLGPTLQAQFKTLGSGSTVEHIRVPDAEKVIIPFPPLPTQRKIAAILSAYDDLIENNKRRIAILENMAEEIYREWFVRFRFPGWKNAEFEKGIPKGWEIVNIGDSKIQILDGDRGKAYPKKEEFSEDGFCLFLSTSNVREGKFEYSQCDFITETKDSQLRKGRVNIGDIVLTTRGTIGNIAYLGINSPFKVVRINSGMVIIRAAEDIFKTIFYYLLFNSKSMQDNYKMFSSGSAQPQLPIRDLKKIKFILPLDEILTKFGKITKPMIDQSDLLNVQNMQLDSIKKKLLSRLISGKLSVEDLDIQLPASMSAKQIVI